jgi:hypothetical protein
VNKCVSTKTVHQDISVNQPMSELRRKGDALKLVQVNNPSSKGPQVCDGSGCRPLYSTSKQVCTASKWSCNLEEGFTWTDHGCLRRCLPPAGGTDDSNDSGDTRDLNNCAPSEACLPLDGEHFCRLLCDNERVAGCAQMRGEFCYRGLCTSFRTADPIPPLCNQDSYCAKSEYCDRGGCSPRPSVGDSKEQWELFCARAGQVTGRWIQVTENAYQCVDRDTETSIILDEEGAVATVSERQKLRRTDRKNLLAGLSQGRGPLLARELRSTAIAPSGGSLWRHRETNQDGCEVYDTDDGAVFHSITVCKGYSQYHASAPAAEQPGTVDDKGTAAAGGEVVPPDSQNVN